MKLTLLLIATVASSALHERLSQTLFKVKDSISDIIGKTEDSIHSAGNSIKDFQQIIYEQALTTASEYEQLIFDDGKSIAHLLDSREGPHPPHKGPHPHPPHKDPHHPPPHHNPHDQKDKTIYQFLSESEYFTILTSIIDGDKHAVEELNKTAANLTLFAPTDKALEKYAEHAPPVEYLRKILLYHLLPAVVPAGQVLRARTLETLYKEEDFTQRLAVDLNFRGLTLNYYARIIYVDLFTSNGVVHAIDNLLFPPPKIYDIAETLPTAFSTFINAAWKTGLVETLNETKHTTVFAPSNFAFAKLGVRINAYLFSQRGTPTLKKLLMNHVVPDVLFYSDFVAQGLVQHYDLKTLGGPLSVDVSEWGRFKSIVFNGRTLSVSDIPAKNGVLSKLSGVILPYKQGLSLAEVSEMSIDEFEGLFEDDVDECRHVIL